MPQPLPPIAVTGLGLLSPLGLSLQDTLDALTRGDDPRAPSTGPDGAATPDLDACPLPEGFNPKAALRRRKDLKLMARANRLAVVAARQAVEHAGLLDDEAALAEAGLFLGVGREPGNLDDLLPMLTHSVAPSESGPAVSLDRLIDEGMGWMNPLSSLKTLPNMSPAHVAITLGITGVNHALCAEAESGLTAIAEAALAVAEGRAPLALAGGADSRVDVTDRLGVARQIFAGDRAAGPVGEGAAVLVLEPLAAAQARGATVHGLIQIERGAPTDPDDDLPWGDCGAATSAMACLIALAQGRPYQGHGITAQPGAPLEGAPAVHIPPADRAAVAITAVGLRTPLGHQFGGFTEALLAGRCGTDLIRRFDARRFPVKVACEVQDEGDLPRALAAAMAGLEDRKGELALLAALDAASRGGPLPAETAVLYATGLSSATATELNQDYVHALDGAGGLDFAALGPRAGVRYQSPWRHLVDRPARLIRRHLGLTGPWACHFSACAAGSAAIGHGADLIRRGLAPVALVGGGDSMVHPFGMMPFIRLGAATEEADPLRAGRPFDKDRSGFVMGEGAAFFRLEPYAAAKAAGRPILGVIAGWGSSLDAYNVTAPHPEGHGAAKAMRGALADAGWRPEQIGYVNAHGTGTALNDVAEAKAVRAVFGAGAPPVSSSKAQLGHAIAAAGALELAACLAAFAGGALPPNPHTDQADPAIDLDLVGAVGRPGAPAALLSNSFGFGGQNACLAVAHPEAVDQKGRLR